MRGQAEMIQVEERGTKGERAPGDHCLGFSNGWGPGGEWNCVSRTWGHQRAMGSPEEKGRHHSSAHSTHVGIRLACFIRFGFI